MPKVKNIAYPAVAGFALSFFISIVATHRFGLSLLKGLLFGVIFAVLAFFIDFVWGRFLGDGSEPSDLSGESNRADKNVGNKVDITIDDAELSDDGKSLSFAVDRNRAKLSEADTQDLRNNDVLFVAESQDKKQPLFDRPANPASAAAAPAAEGAASVSSAGAGDFKPVSLGAPLSAAGAGEPSPAPKGAASVKASAAPGRKASSGDGELDALPDIGGFDAGDNYVTESDMEEDGSPAESPAGPMDYSGSRSPSSGNGSRATEHDTATLAKAISTVLKRDEMS